MTYEAYLASRTSRMGASAIREILKVVSAPGMVSLAGGIPAIETFNPYEPRYVRIETDEEGAVPESLEAVLKRDQVKFVYLVPTFQNPTGKTLSLRRREEIARIICRHKALLVEDDPYSMLRYRGEPLPPIYTFAPENTLYISTLSKVFAPGLRIGFFLAPPPLDRWLVLAKQGVDLHTSTLNQALAAEYIAGGYLHRQQAMLEAMEKHFPSVFTWTKPEGGMFIWAEGPNDLDLEQMYYRAIERKVAYVPGKFFFTESGEGLATMRLNFTCSDPETLVQAIRTLGDVLTDSLKEIPAGIEKETAISSAESRSVHAL